MGLLSKLFGWGKKKPEKKNQVVNDDEDYFKDITLSIESDSDTGISHIYIAKAKLCNRETGLKVEIMSDLPAGINRSGEITKDGFVADAVLIASIGEESDNFIRSTAELYGLPKPDRFSQKPLSFTIFSLNEHDADLSRNGYYMFKLFMETEDLYGEIYLNINLDKQIIELKEKDQEYRQAIITHWSEKV